jgi:hypothetical protein
MAQSIILAAGTTVAPSTDIVIGQNETAAVGLFVAAGAVPDNANFALFQKTPGAANRLAAVKPNVPVVIAGPGTYYVQRLAGGTQAGVPDTQVAVGVYKDQ